MRNRILFLAALLTVTFAFAVQAVRVEPYYCPPYQGTFVAQKDGSVRVVITEMSDGRLAVPRVEIIANPPLAGSAITGVLTEAVRTGRTYVFNAHPASADGNGFKGHAGLVIHWETLLRR